MVNITKKIDEKTRCKIRYKFSSQLLIGVNEKVLLQVEEQINPHLMYRPWINVRNQLYIGKIE